MFGPTLSPIDWGAFDPSQLPSALQWFLDNNQGYSPSLVAGYPALKSLERYTSLATPRSGRAYLFDGADDYGTRANESWMQPGAGSWTVTAWVKRGTGSFPNIISCRGFANSTETGWAVGVDSANTLSCYWGDGTTGAYLVSANAVSNTTLEHWAVVFDKANGKVSFYRNGALDVEHSPSFPAGTVSPLTALFVGRDSAAGTRIFGGSLRDVRVYNVAKSAGEVAAIRNQHLTPNTLDRAGLQVGYWCEEESGTTAYDWSGNGRHLTLTNVTQSTFHSANTGVLSSAANDLGHSLGVNMLRYSGQIGNNTNPGWNRFGPNLTVTLNAGADPFGGNQATLITRNTAGGSAIYSQDSIAVNASSVYVGSIYVKNVNAATVSFEVGNGANTSGQVVYTFATNNITLPTGFNTVVVQATGVEPVGNGWYRLWMRIATTSTWTGNTNFTVYATANAGESYLAYGAQLEAAQLTPLQPTTTMPLAGIVLPRDEAKPAKDVTGNTLGNGPLARPATIEVPCVTGDGSAVYCDLGNLGYTSGSYTSVRTRFTFKSPGSLGLLFLYSKWGSSPEEIECHITGTGQLRFIPKGGVYYDTPINTIATSAWYAVDFQWSTTAGATCTINGVAVGLTNAGGGNPATAGTFTSSNLYLLRRNAGTGYYNSASISDFRLTVNGGAEINFPIQSGPGASNTNRDLSYCKSDGTGGVVSNAIVNGTVSTIWSNLCPYSQDWCVNYGGGIAANGAFIPGRINSNLDASGNTKTLTAGKHGNPYSRILPNRWDAPSLYRLGYTSSTRLAPVDNYVDVAPANTKFRRYSNDGSDRYASYLAALTSADLANASSYGATPLTGDVRAFVGTSTSPVSPNLLTFTEQFDNAAWAKTTSVVGAPTVTANQIAAPDGQTTADKIDFPAVPATTNFSIVSRNNTSLNGTYTFSIYLRGAVGGEVVYLTLSSGTPTTSTACVLTTSWQRFSITAATASNLYTNIGVDLRDNTEAAQPAQAIYAWGAQLEVGSSPSTYVANPLVISKAVTGVGFAPKLVMLFGARGNTTSTQAVMTFGAGKSSSNRSVVAVRSQNGVTTSDTSRFHSNAEIYKTYTGNGTITEAADLASLDANGFTLNFTATLGEAFNHICLGGADLEVNLVQCQTNNTGAAQSFAHGLSGPPTGLFLFSAVNASPPPNSNPNLSMTMGAFASGNQFGTVLLSTTGLTTTLTRRYLATNRTLAWMNIGGSIARAMSIDSVDAANVNVSYPVNDNYQAYFWILAVRGAKCQVGTFDCNSSLSPYTIATPGITPKLFLPVFSPTGATSPGSVLNTVLITIGACDGTNNAACGITDATGVTTTNSRRYQSSNSLVSYSSGGVKTFEATASFSGQSVVITPTVNTGSLYDQGGYLIIGK